MTLFQVIGWILRLGIASLATVGLPEFAAPWWPVFVVINALAIHVLWVFARDTMEVSLSNKTVVAYVVLLLFLVVASPRVYAVAFKTQTCQDCYDSFGQGSWWCWFHGC